MRVEYPAAEDDDVFYPTLGPQVADFIEANFTYGPGSLQGQPARLTDDQRRVLYRAYEHFPKGHKLYGMDMSGRRRFQRVSWSVRKGSAKTEFMAWVTGCELHPDAPVRFNGYIEDITEDQEQAWTEEDQERYTQYGLAPGRAVNNPYIPLLAYTKDQTEELAFGALRSILETAPDADRLFDIGKQRIIRKNEYGAEDGKCHALAGNPNSADGARTTFQGLDETHRLYTDTHRDAIETMLQNLPKRPMEDPWQLAITTAGEPGQGSYAEDEYKEGIACAAGKKKSEGFYFLHRQAPDGSKFNTMQQRMEAIWWATSPSVREWTRFDSIAANWDREGADTQYLERVWTNRWTQTASQAFNRDEFEALGDSRFRIPDGAFVTVGFDGAKFQDSTGFVVTDIETGRQNVLGFWERPDDSVLGKNADGTRVKWQVPEAEVNATFDDIMRRFKVWRVYADPPHWVETVGHWHAKHPDQVYEFWTKEPTRMYYAVKGYRSAISSGDVSHDGDPDFVDHIGNAGKRTTRGEDEDGQPRFVLTKISYERKFDLAMAGILSWEARMDAINEGAEPPVDAWEIIRAR
ncbi:terminase large subunit [Gordonia phage Outis]|nr:terminase large subunit [Gordonia phage StarStruck]WKW84998.1 terminase large subunit [Gordonia phage Outis]